MSKKILITGKNSYVGNKLAEWLNKEPQEYTVVKESVRDGKWKEINFSNFDVVVHVAGIAHMRETKKNEEIYYKVNRDLTYEIAKKAKNDGVKQFIFISTMSVYGKNEGIITQDTPLKPNSAYGKSKLQAEQEIKKLLTHTFKVTIVRPPMIYGPNCTGNYSKLSLFAQKTKFFPNIMNQRSMLFIDNLSHFLLKIIELEQVGIFFPQNAVFTCTTDMIGLISKIHGNHIKISSILNLLIKHFNLTIIKKVFGTLVYDQNLSKTDFNYNICNFEESIIYTEKGRGK